MWTIFFYYIVIIFSLLLAFSQSHIISMESIDFPFDEAGIIELDNTYSHENFHKMLENEVINNAMGCLFGSFIGDALGALLEFSKEKFGDQFKRVMEMPGGGVFRLKEGQITDDSQLAFHLLQALTKLQLTKKFDDQVNPLIKAISKQYLDWFSSKPFDIGLTCRNSLNQIKKVHQQGNFHPQEAFIQKMLARVKVQSEKSESNGSLMRCTPIPFIFSLTNKHPSNQSPKILNIDLQLTKQSMTSFMKKQTSLLHPNKNNVQACYLWQKFLITLIKRKDNNQLKGLTQSVKKYFQKNIPSWGKFLTQKHQIRATQNIGWSKIAISLAFEVLDKFISLNCVVHKDTYSQMIKQILSRGGDTDTNAAIVGGMIGAIVGFKNLPPQYLRKLLELRHKSEEKRYRPKFYEPRMAFVNAYKLIKMMTS